MKTLILDGTAISIQVAMSTSAATTNPTFVSTYADNAGSGITEGATDGVLNGSTDVTVVPAPTGTNRRVIKGITIYNGDTAAVTVFVKYDNNATQRTLVKVTLNVGDTWTTDGVFDSNGSLKQTLGTVNLSTVTGVLGVVNGGSGAATLTGVLKGNGTSAFTAATAGTDYLAPPSGTALLKANSGGALANATAGTDYLAPAAIGVTVQAWDADLDAWAGKAAPTGTVVGTSDTQTLSAKTIEAGTFTNGYTEETVTANTSTAYTIDLANGSVQILTLTGNCTYTFPTVVAGKSFILLQFQDGTGSRTVTWPASVKWPAGTAPTITATASKMDKFVFTANGSYWYGSVAGQNF